MEKRKAASSRDPHDALDPEVSAFYADKIRRRAFAAPADITVEALRAGADETFNDRTEIEPIFAWEERLLEFPKRAFSCADAACRPYAERIFRADVPAMRVRIYRPAAGEGRPLVLYFHGGGFVIHNLASHDALARKIANTWDAVVVSAGYRLAPEHPYPAAIEDGWALLWWAKEHAREIGADPDRIYLSGDSAGAAISASVSRLASCAGKAGAVSGQILFYGSYGDVEAENDPSLQTYGDGGFVLPRESIRGFMKYYLPYGTDPADIVLYPGAGGIPSDLPRTVVVSAECDPLRGDGERFARRMREAGNDTREILAKGMMHGFLLYWHKFRGAVRALEEAGREAGLTK